MSLNITYYSSDDEEYLSATEFEEDIADGLSYIRIERKQVLFSKQESEGDIPDGRKPAPSETPPPLPIINNAFAIETKQNLNSDEYDIDFEYKGFALIFNHHRFNNPAKYANRDGTEKDVERLKSILSRMKYYTDEVCENYTYDQIRDKIGQLGKSQYILDKLRKSASIMVFILSHGEIDNQIVARDRTYDLYEIITLFTPNFMEVMAGKPKCFLVQACRGEKLDAGFTLQQMGRSARLVKDSVDSKPEIRTYPIFADILIGFSSHRDHYSFRNRQGSWFIQEFCNAIEEIKEETNILDILLKTNRRVAERCSFSDILEHDEKKQISAFYSLLTRRFIICPIKKK